MVVFFGDLFVVLFTIYNDVLMTFIRATYRRPYDVEFNDVLATLNVVQYTQMKVVE